MHPLYYPGRRSQHPNQSRSILMSDTVQKWAFPFVTNTPFTLALLIRSETGFAPLRAFTLHQLIRINNLIRIKLNHLLEVVSHRFSLLRDLITSVDANRTRTKEEQIEINARGCICIYGVACQELSRSRSSARLSTKYHCKLSVAIL